MAGINSPASAAAQSGPVSFVTADAAGNLATTTFDVSTVIDVGTEIDELRTDLSTLTVELRRGTAMAMAMATASMPSAPGRTSWASNVAVFSGEVAAAFAFAHRFDVPSPLAVTGAVSAAGNKVGARIGLAGEF